MHLPIIDGQRNHGVDFQTHARTFIADFARRRGVNVPPCDQVAGAEPLEARVDAGRWIAECPDCHDAQYVWAADPSPVFMCVTCFNALHDGLWRRVTMPAQREDIEAELERRPMPGNRHWRPGESVADLRTETVAHGIEA